MKIFITVGTTPFDKLITFCDNNIVAEEHDVKMQISNLARYKPENFEYFAYTHDIKELYHWADVVIAHAGSGTLFQLLEMGKKAIFVPNNIHKDAHQNDLCRFVDDNDFAFVLNDYERLNSLLHTISAHRFAVYKKEESQVAEYIAELILAGGD